MESFARKSHRKTKGIPPKRYLSGSGFTWICSTTFEDVRNDKLWPNEKNQFKSKLVQFLYCSGRFCYFGLQALGGTKCE